MKREARMPNILYTLEKKTVEAESSETILQVSMRTGVPHAHACGGNARCSTCRVLILDGLEYCEPRNPNEQLLADRLNFTPEIRLACQTTFTGDLTLRRLVLDDEDLQLAGQQTSTSGPCSVGEEKQLAVLFADIRGFTPFAEALPPYDVVHVLNRYFHRMGVVISPPLPAFYTRPSSIDAMVDHSVSRILDQIGIHLDVNRWSGEMEAAIRETD